MQAASASLHASTTVEGILVYDDNAKKLKVCDGDNWIDVGSGSGSDTLTSLSCAAGEIVKFNGTAWECAADGGGSGGGTGSYMLLTSAAQTYVAGGKANFTTVVAQGGSNISQSGGEVTLKGGHTYLMSADLRLSASNAALGYLIVEKVSGSNVGVMGAEHTGTAASGWSQSNAFAVVSPGTDTTYYVQTNSFTGAPATAAGQGTFYVEQVDGGSGADTLGGLSCASGEIPKWSGTAWECAEDGGGSGVSSTPVAFYAVRTAAGNVNQGNTIVFDSERVDTASAYDPATGAFTAPQAGVYQFSWGGIGNTTDDVYYIDLYKNGSNTGASLRIDTMASGAHYGNGSAVRYLTLAQGDTVTVFFSDGAALYGSGGYTFFGGHLIGGGSDTLASLSCSVGEIPKWSGGVWVCAADGGGSSGQDVSFFAHRNAVNYSISAATETTIDFTHERFDSNDSFDPATDQFKPAVPGKYLVSASVTSNNAVAAGIITYMRIRKNGTTPIAGGYATGSGNAVTPQATAIVEMNGTTDYLEVMYYDASGSPSVYGQPAYTYFTATLLGSGGSSADTLSGLSCATNEIPKWNGTAWACAVDGGGGLPWGNEDEIPSGLNASNVLNHLTFNGSAADTGTAASGTSLVGTLAYTAGKFWFAANEFSTANRVSLTRQTLASHTANGLTAAAWVRGTNTTATPSDWQVANNIFGDTAAAVNMGAGVAQGKAAIRAVSTEIRSTASVADGEWNHIAFVFTYAGGTWAVKIYVNGQPNGTGTLPTASNPHYAVSSIGATYASYTQYHGYAIDNAYLFNTALTDAQVEELYEAGTSASGSGGSADTLAGLSCTSGQVPSWNGSAWECADMVGGGVPAGTIAAFAATTCPTG